MKEAIVSLAYKSRSTASEVDANTLSAILSVAQIQNVENYLTGALAYGDGHFIQVLEGPEDRLLRIFQKIRGDFRHHSIEFVGPTPIANRRFPDWCMASLSVDTDLQPIFSALIAEWPTLGIRASALLATSLQE